MSVVLPQVIQAVSQATASHVAPILVGATAYAKRKLIREAVEGVQDWLFSKPAYTPESRRVDQPFFDELRTTRTDKTPMPRRRRTTGKRRRSRRRKYKRGARSYKKRSRKKRIYVKRNRTRYKRGMKTRSRKTYSKVTSSLQARVHKLEKRLRLSRGHFVYRKRTNNTLTALANKQNYYQHFMNNRSDVRSRLVLLPVLSAATDTLKDVDYTAVGVGKGDKKCIYVTKLRMEVFNPFNTVAECMLYELNPRQDANFAPIELIDSGLTHAYEAGGYTDKQDLLVSPKDSAEFLAGWKINNTKQFKLKPNQSRVFSTQCSPREYSAVWDDKHTSTYQNTLGTRCFLLRIRGTLGPDSGVTTAQRAYRTTARVYMTFDERTDVYYAANADIYRVKQLDSGVPVAPVNTAHINDPTIEAVNVV